MEFETIDESEHQLPSEAVTEMKGMIKWMTVSAVIMIIYAILGMLGNITMLSNTSQGKPLFDIILNGINIWLGFMVIKTSGHFNSFADNRDENSLIEGLRLTKNYWMICVILSAFSVIISIILR